MEIVDSHQHFWQIGRFDYEWMSADDTTLYQDFLPGPFESVLRSNGVSRSVVVQAHQSMAETHWLLELANKYDFIAGVVGWVDLQDPDIEIHLKELASDPKFKGVRHLVQDESSDDWLTRPEVLRGLRCLSKYDLAYDLLVFTRHLPFAKKTVQQLPDQRFVIDHLAKPPISQRKIAEWRSALSEIAAFPNVLCKLSGLVTEADHDSWCPDDVHPYVETALDLFGPDRLMFGSDYPVCLLAASYSEVFDTYKSFLEHLNQEERSRVLFHNAVDFYRL